MTDSVDWFIVHLFTRFLPPMILTLSQLRDFVNEKIAEQGEDAPSVSYIFTKEDIKDEDGETMKGISNSYATEVLEYFDGISDHYREKLEGEMGDCISMCDPEVYEDPLRPLFHVLL